MLEVSLGKLSSYLKQEQRCWWCVKFCHLTIYSPVHHFIVHVLRFDFWIFKTELKSCQAMNCDTWCNHNLIVSCKTTLIAYMWNILAELMPFHSKNSHQDVMQYILWECGTSAGTRARELQNCLWEAGEGEISWLGIWLLLTGDVQSFDISIFCVATINFENKMVFPNPCFSDYLMSLVMA